MGRAKKSQVVIAHPENCSGCLVCAMICSWTFTGRFNPSESRILINFPGDIQRTVVFTRDCDSCGVCVEYCNFDALEVVEA